MDLVKLESADGDYWVVPEHVTWIQGWGDDETKIGIVGGDPIIVTGTPDTVGLRLQGRG